MTDPLQKVREAALELPETEERLSHGQALVCSERGNGVVRVYADGVFAGLAEIRGGIMRARRLLAQEESGNTASTSCNEAITQLNPKHFSG